MSDVLELRGITKAFPGTLANDAVDLTLRAGEIHALLGENGAGKSTLVKIVYGLLQADSGTILWRGQPAAVTSPAAARRLGIGMVFQHFSLFEALTVAENVALGLDDRTPMAALARRIADVSDRYGLALDPHRSVHTLSVGERQRVEIVRCLLQDPALLILDEPTSVLTPQECDRLFETLRRLAAEGRTLLYISHKLDEIRALCDRATVMRGGRVVAACDPRQETARSLAEMMIGRRLPAPTRAAHPRSVEPRLVVDGLSLPPGHAFGTALRGISFAVPGGEVFGIAGVAGNGQAELLTALSGERRVPAQALRLDGRPVGALSPGRRRRLGLAFVPEERLGQGAVPEMSLSDNAQLTGHAVSGLAEGGVLRPARAHAFAARVIADYGVVAAGPSAEARSLSGGNLQKFIVGREVMQKPRLLLVAAPTWGVDAGAAAFLHQALLDLARDGVAVVVVSQDLDELLAISDRIAVLYHGTLSAPMPAQSVTVEALGLLMGGADPEHADTDRAAADPVPPRAAASLPGQAGPGQVGPAQAGHVA